MTGLPLRDRRRALILLAGSLYDYLASAEGSLVLSRGRPSAVLRGTR